MHDVISRKGRRFAEPVQPKFNQRGRAEPYWEPTKRTVESGATDAKGLPNNPFTPRVDFGHESGTSAPGESHALGPRDFKIHEP